MPVNPSQRTIRQLSPATVQLIAHIQHIVECEKALLARDLHDELGGMLMAVAMDLSWLQAHVPDAQDPLQQKLSRARQTLAVAVDLKRKIIENLRPSLLDTIGLFAALRWHMSSRCGVAGLLCDTRLPEVEPSFDDEMSLALFRIAEGGLAMTLDFPALTSAAMRVEIAEEFLTLQITGAGAALSAQDHRPGECHAFEVIRHRTAAIGGNLQLNYPVAGGIELAASIPLGVSQMCV